MRQLLIAFSVVTLLAGHAAFAVSDGQYLPANQGCTANADNSDDANRTEAGCHNMIVFVADGTGHQYAGWGLDQTADGTLLHSGEVWVDPGIGSRYTWNFDLTAGSVDQMPTVTLSTPGDPTTGVHVYFGADDNLDSGEHDSSEKVSNGPSDGGGMVVDIAPAAATAWLAILRAMDTAGLLAAPAPFANGGLGACADGFCIAVTTQRRVAYQGARTDIHRDVANYVWSDGTPMVWDPYNCAGPTDTKLYCSDPTGTYTIKYWYKNSGTVYTEPGIQIYEDPDPQGSPGVLSVVGLDQLKQALTGSGQDPYPLPALYLGTCGLVFGGGAQGDPTRFDGTPLSNSAGQIVVKTGCN
jgi:hypothetical protein